MTDYLLVYFVSSYSISIIRSPSSACFSSSVALIFTLSLKVHHRPIHQALMKNKIPALDQGLRAVYWEARHWQQLVIFIQDWFERLPFNFLVLSFWMQRLAWQICYSYSQLCKICLNVQLSRHAQKHKITLFSFHELLNWRLQSWKWSM